MANSLPQFYPNNLNPVAIEEPDLHHALRILRAAIREGIQIVLSADRPGQNETGDPIYGTIFTGDLGMSDCPYPQAVDHDSCDLAIFS
jgi:hypothetical protein